ncbi:endonuclease VIII [Glaciecola sp. XM2]|jgi:endonuclease-8|uniref:endonuclease VIII n=1 Tax=Glaciecola sp. XM2 TaxID=1914931 RepID=UPI001BDF308E|nr:endonuclease VIII [Glaciecola sp. XM2]MBT1451799.1 endonuclease VIII [Glaciecola sp. XM2]
MPEGPEIRRAADTIAKVIEGKVIEEVQVGLARLESPAKQLKGQRVRQVETRGKAMLIHFDNGLSVYSHNQLYGVWKTAKRGSLPNTKRSLRLALHAEDKSALLYSASDIGIYRYEELPSHPFLSKIGPDILDASLTWQKVSARLLDKRFCNRRISTLYLDQHFIAGIGNYLRTEILYAANIHPDLKPKQLSSEQIKALAKQTLEISHRAYQTKGHTVPGRLAKTLAKTKGSYESVRFMAFNREGLPCRKCVTPIVKAQRNGRRIYWCEGCLGDTKS